jgi:cytochrome c5
MESDGLAEAAPPATKPTGEAVAPLISSVVMVWLVSAEVLTALGNTSALPTRECGDGAAEFVAVGGETMSSLSSAAALVVSLNDRGTVLMIGSCCCCGALGGTATPLWGTASRWKTTSDVDDDAEEEGEADGDRAAWSLRAATAGEDTRDESADDDDEVEVPAAGAARCCCVGFCSVVVVAVLVL